MSEEQPKCPVDHSARETWSKNISNPVPPHPIPQQEADKCPVDHNARAKWASMGSNGSVPIGHPQVSSESADKCPVDHTARGKWVEIGQQQRTVIDGSKIPTAVETLKNQEHSSSALPDEPIYETNTNLPVDREISTIPRTGSNANWIYPSQKQFFEAMKRKNWNPSAQDMETVVPIHNAVNERAWYQILKWEEGQGGEKCGGIQLTSFKGDSKKLTPKAGFFALLGYQKPFDRHDWTIDRCGVEVDYVIDFYQGRPNPNLPQMASFYLDVRPKLNSIEGIQLRIKRFFGF